MDRYKKILTIENEIEARLLKKFLDEAEIPYVLKSYYDSALDGLYQTQRGWGHIEAPEKYEKDILGIYYGAINTNDS
jgi:hypothetical protein